MRRKLLYIISLLSLSLPLFATSFEEGVAAYSDADYPKAIECFNKALEEGKPTAEIYYNLASAYYKNNDLPLAILNFERAYRIDPSDGDTRFNLELVSSQIVDDMEPTPRLFLSRWFDQVSHWFSLFVWRVLGLIFFTLLMVGIFFYFRGRSISQRQIGFYGGVAALVVSVLTNILAYRSYLFTHEDKEAILISSIITVKSSPDASAKDIVVVHGGLKVVTQQTLSGYTEIKLPDGTVGWVPNNTFEIINNFTH